MASFAVRTEQELLHAIEQDCGNTLVLTSTVRAARALRTRYDQLQRKRDRTGWIAPRILAWEPWLHTLWNAAVLSGTENRVLLSPLQETTLWQYVLEQDETARQTLSYLGLAELAQQSYRALNLYGLSLRELRGSNDKDCAAFLSWADAFEARCRKSSFVTASQMESALAKLADKGFLTFPQEMYLFGFDRTHPSQTLLIEAMSRRNCTIHKLQLQSELAQRSQQTIVVARTLDEEIDLAAQWIRQKLLSSPHLRIGLIIPASGEIRNHIDARFRAVLAPSTMDVRVRNAPLPYEFSLGTPMVYLQPVRTALTLLRWLQEPIAPEEISWLLVHGGFSSGPLDARAKLDRRFRDRKSQLGGPLSLASFREWLAGNQVESEEKKESVPLRRTLDNLSALVWKRAFEKQRSFAEWREFIEQALTTADLHLLISSDSQDYQMLQRWNSLLNSLSSLNVVAGTVSFSAALEKLTYLATHTLFTLETHDAPVQVLGIPESAGLVFDAIWWLNAQASAWPPQGKAQPFIPWELQRASHMPYADPAEDFAFAQRATRRILASANNVVVSFALQSNDSAATSAHAPEPEIVLSPLVREALPEIPITAAHELDSARMEAPHLDVAMELVLEESAVPLVGDEISGGVRFLELQAACPFRAFTELRLNAQPLENPATGLSARDQGTVMHRVLQRFWQEVGSQKELLGMRPSEHRRILQKHIGTVLAGFEEHASEAWQKTLLQIEAQRIEERLVLWLEREKGRSDFTVLGVEQPLKHSMEDVSFHARLDRVDSTEQGLVLLDYKTGAVDRSSCTGDRPDQPQLLAYAVLRDAEERTKESPSPLAGIAFAGLHPRKTDFTIVASLPGVFTKITQSGRNEDSAETKNTRAEAKSKRTDVGALRPEEMQEQLMSWENTLRRLAADFSRGVPVIDPKNEQTCTYCTQSLICRIHEAEEMMSESHDQDDCISPEGSTNV